MCGILKLYVHHYKETCPIVYQENRCYFNILQDNSIRHTARSAYSQLTIIQLVAPAKRFNGETAQILLLPPKLEGW